MKQLLGQTKEKAEKAGRQDSIRKALLSELILLKVIKPNENGDPEVDPTAAKEWAFTCGEMVGMLAGLACKPHVVDKAIDEVTLVARDIASQLRAHLQEMESEGKIRINDDPGNGKPKPTSQDRAQQEQMIAELEAQAVGEKDLAVQAALRAMAARMRRELEEGINSKENAA